MDGLPEGTLVFSQWASECFSGCFWVPSTPKDVQIKKWGSYISYYSYIILYYHYCTFANLMQYNIMIIYAI